MLSRSAACVFVVLSFVANGRCGAATPWDQMDHGTVFRGFVEQVPKGVAVRIGDGKAAMLYDQDTLRLVGGWTGAFIALAQGRDGIEGLPRAANKLLWQTNQPLGWADPANVDNFADARPYKPFGPLRKDWAHFKGLYMHGQRVVFAYTVGATRVLESPDFQEINGKPVFMRCITIAPHEQPLRMYVCEEKAAGVAMVGAASGVSLSIASGGHVATFAAADKPLSIKLAIVPGIFDAKQLAELAAKAAPAESLEALTKGGPPRYPQTLTTKGELGKETGPYIVDTLTAPYTNPWNSYLRFAGNDFFDNGDAIVVSISGDAWRVSGIDEKLENLTWKRYATGLFHPLGVRVVDNVAYVICRDQICRLRDLNDDGEVDFYETFNNDVVDSCDYHAFHTELHTDAAGNFYYQKCGSGNNRLPHYGCVLRVSKDGSKLDVFATGLRNANGLGVSPTGVVTSGDQQGDWVPSSRLDLVREGGFYGYLPAHHRAQQPQSYDRPLCWIPHSVDNSCAGQVWVESKKWGPFEGDCLHLSYGKCRIFKVMIDEVEGGQQGDVQGRGDVQGGVVEFPLAFNSGVMRGRFSPHDGQLYLSGMRGWQTSSPQSAGFQRVRYTGQPVHMPRRLKAREGKIEIEFTSPLDRAAAEDIDNYNIEQWNYRWTKDYGSKDYLVSNAKKEGRDELEIDDVQLLDDNKTVVLEIDALQPVMQMAISYRLKSADGGAIVGPIYSTINVLGKARIGN